MAEKERLLVAVTHYGRPTKWDCLILMARGIWVEQETAADPFGDWKNSPLNGEDTVPESGIWVIEMRVDIDTDGFHRRSTEWRRPTLDEMAHITFGHLQEMWGPSVIQLEEERQHQQELEESAELDKLAAADQKVCIPCYTGSHHECLLGTCTCTHQFKD